MAERKFELGQVVMTRGVADLLAGDEPDEGPCQERLEELRGCIARHHSGDWGEVCDDDKRLNDEALQYGSRLLSAYTLGGDQIWVITEADRSSTTVLLPGEY